MSYKDIISNLSPDFWWELNGDGDDSIGSHNPDASDAPTFIKSIVPAAATRGYNCGDFNGTSDYYRYLSDNDINNLAVVTRAISVWVKTDTTTTGNGRPLWTAGGGTSGQALYQYGSAFYFYVYESSGSNEDYVNTGTISIDTLYHIGAVLNCTAGTMELFINGVSVDSKSSLNVGASVDAHGGVKPRIGAGQSTLGHAGSIGTAYFDGKIADFVYWNGTLTATEIKSIYDAGIKKPDSLMLAWGL